MSSKKCKVFIYYKGNYTTNRFLPTSTSNIYSMIYKKIAEYITGEDEKYTENKYKVKYIYFTKNFNKINLFNEDPRLEDNWEEFITGLFNKLTKFSVTVTALEKPKWYRKYESVKKTEDVYVKYIIEFGSGNNYTIEYEENENADE